MAEDSELVLEALHEGPEYILYRGRDGRDQTPILAVTPVAEQPSARIVGRLQAEYSLATQLDPAWAARPRSLTRHRGRVALVLEDPGGEPLERVIEQYRGSPIDLGKVLRIAVDVTSALGQVHRQGLIHRDVKPAAILVDSADRVWLTGFGIASRLPRERLPPAAPEVIAGTLAYMSPEQTGRMNRSVDARSDLYSLGVTLYQLVTGVLPFAAADALEWVHSHMARQPVPPAKRRAVPEPLSAIIMRLLAKNAEERYRTAAGLEADLRHCMSEWQSRGRIDPFVPGASDFPDHLLIPEKLYGRQREVDALTAAFDRVVTQGTVELVLVSGYSGVGKSSVVNELHKVLVPPRGIFAAGKFDQYKRDVPYATLAQAFQTLVRQILVKNEAEVDHWRRTLQEALGPNGQLMVNLVPELEFLIGKQPPAAELAPQEARARFQLVFLRFLDALARPEHPLALFLDDLQWLDTASLELLERVATHPGTRHLLLVGAYRDNEVTPAHPLSRTLAAMRDAGARICELVLAPLAIDDVRQFVADALHIRLESAGPLALLVHERTRGNPFFAIQLLTSLAEEGLLRFDRGAAGWDWDLDRIRAKGYSYNVVDLMLGKLRRLSQRTQTALQQFACLGNEAEIALLAVAAGQAEEELHAALWDAVRAGLIVRLEQTYAFLHDRIQEAAYTLIDGSERTEVHLRIGRRLLANLTADALAEHLFNVAGQLNNAAALLVDHDEKAHAAEIDLQAGRKAKASAAYASALKYLIAGAELLGDHGWASRGDLMFALELERAGCEFLLGELAAADARLVALANHATHAVDQASLACLHIDVCTTLDQSDRAIVIALEFLRHVGFDWSPHPTEHEARLQYERTWSLLQDRNIDELIELPAMSDPKYIATLEVLERSLKTALYTDANLLALMICGLVNISLEHGHTGASCDGYIWLGMIAGPRFGDYEAGFRFGRLGYDLAERSELERCRAHTYLSFAVLIVPWTKHVRIGEQMIRRAFDAATAIGDLTTAASCGVDLFGNLLTRGDPLAEVQRKAEQSLEFSRNARFGLLTDISATQVALVRALRGLTTRFGCFNDSQFDESEMERRLATEEGRAIAACWYWVRKVQARYFAGDYAAAVAASANAQQLLWTSPSFLETADAHFYGALSHAASCDAASPVEYRQHVDALEAHSRQLAEWAEHCPENFENRSLLVAAEMARLEGRALDAERLYEGAIASARRSEFVHNEALANELAARFYAARGLEAAGYGYLRNARDCYQRWGADGKLKQLDELHPDLRRERSRSTAGPSIGQLDAEAVVKASQALSSEMVLPRLIERLMQIAVEHAGAERGVLILVRDGEPRIEADARTGLGKIEVVARHGAAIAPSDLPRSVLHYVIRTQERVLLDDAASDSVYSEDEYLRQKDSHSILCLPIVKQKRLIGALYLENGLSPGVFTPDRVAVLELLASQASISLENAALYSELEIKVGLLQVLPVSAWTLKPDGTPDFVNQVWLEFAGQTLDFVRSRPEAWMTAIHPEDRETALKAFWAGVRSGRAFSFETRALRARDMTYRWHLQQAVALRDGEGRVLKFVGTTTDIDDQKRTEEALRQTQANLAHVARVAALSAMTASIVHEVSQPLSGILTNANAGMRMLAADPPSLTGVAESLQRSIRDAERASQVLQRLRAMFTAKAPTVEPIDLNAAARDVITLSSNELQRGGTLLETKFADDLPVICADRVQIQQVILNLLLNAVDAMSKVEDRPRTLLVETNLVSEGRVELAVRDSGTGVETSALEKVFQAFYTTKAHGMGIGLSICRSIIESHGGHLWASANEGGPGATFAFVLPGANDLTPDT